MKKQLQQGFTLIELMIVVAIIGILASVAIPQYSDYVTKSKISEIMILADGCKTALGESFSDEGRLPATDAGGTVPLDLAKACTDSLELTEVVSAATYTVGADPFDSAVILVTVDIDSLGALDKVAFLLDGSGPIFAYNCSTSIKKGIAVAGTTVLDKYLPSACRS